jgi:hypothetical protein
MIVIQKTQTNRQTDKKPMYSQIAMQTERQTKRQKTAKQTNTEAYHGIAFFVLQIVLGPLHVCVDVVAVAESNDILGRLCVESAHATPVLDTVTVEPRDECTKGTIPCQQQQINNSKLTTATATATKTSSSSSAAKRKYDHHVHTCSPGVSTSWS